MPNNKYEHIFFDLDHTLWDFETNSANAIRILYKEHNIGDRGIDVEQFISSYITYNDKLWVRFRNGEIRREELRWKRFWLALLDFKVGDTNLAHELSLGYYELMPKQTNLTAHAKETLEQISDSYTIHLMTNGYDLTQKMKLQYSGIANYFNEIITSEKSHAMKPNIEIYEYAMKVITGCTKENSLMIGDNLDVDIAGAKNAGWDQVYFNPQKTNHDQKPTYEISCLSQLRDIL